MDTMEIGSVGAKQCPAAQYRSPRYLTKERFASYWHQVSYALEFTPGQVLEIGPGPGIVTDLLRKQSVEIVTCDHADDVESSVRGSVLALPFQDGRFDAVLCCQVLEHLPFELLTPALREIRRVCTRGAVVSLPQSSMYLPYQIYLPLVGRVRFGLKPPAPARAHVFDGQHYWEIDKAGYPEKAVTAVFQAIFRTVRTVRLHENPYHRFYIVTR